MNAVICKGKQIPGIAFALPIFMGTTHRVHAVVQTEACVIKRDVKRRHHIGHHLGKLGHPLGIILRQSAVKPQDPIH